VPYSFGLGDSDAEDEAPSLESMSEEEHATWEEDENERVSQVLQIEHSLRQIVQAYGGQLTLHAREGRDYNANVADRGTDGGTHIGCRFPNETTCSSATEAIMETWNVFGVTVSEADDED